MAEAPKQIGELIAKLEQTIESYSSLARKNGQGPEEGIGQIKGHCHYHGICSWKEVK